MFFDRKAGVEAVKPKQPRMGMQTASRVGLTVALALATTPVLALNLGGIGVGVGVGAGHGGVGAGVGVELGGSSIGAGVGIGTGVDVVDDDGSETGGIRPRVARAGGGGGMACARDGNETAYNSFVVRDRDGDRIGWIHEATVSPEGRILSVRLQSEGSTCYRVEGGNIRVGNGEVWMNADRAAFD
jgi:hypothetical protein